MAETVDLSWSCYFQMSEWPSLEPMVREGVFLVVFLLTKYAKSAIIKDNLDSFRRAFDIPIETLTVLVTLTCGYKPVILSVRYIIWVITLSYVSHFTCVEWKCIINPDDCVVMSKGSTTGWEVWSRGGSTSATYSFTPCAACCSQGLR